MGFLDRRNASVIQPGSNHSRVPFLRETYLFTQINILVGEVLNMGEGRVSQASSTKKIFGVAFLREWMNE